MEILKNMDAKTTKKEINDLYDYGYYIYQNQDYFKFSIDSVLLAEFVCVHKKKNKVLDLCSGNAPVPMILNIKYGDRVDITGVELQKEIFELGIDSIKYNKFKNIKLLNDDIKNIPSKIHDKFDVVTCNPPYFEVFSDNINENEIKAIARHEIKIDLENVINVASKMLENKGYFYMVHRANRLADITNTLNKYKFGIKRIIPVYDKKETDCTFILIESVYNGKNYVKIGKPIFIKENSTYKNIFEEV